MEWNEEAKVSSERRVSLFEDACESGLLKEAERIVKSLDFNDISTASSIFVHSHEIRFNCVETHSNFYEKRNFTPVDILILFRANLDKIFVS